MVVSSSFFFSINIPDITTVVPYTSTPFKNSDSKTNPADIHVNNGNKLDSFSETKIEGCETDIKSNGNLNNKEDKYSQTSATVPKYISPLDKIERYILFFNIGDV